MAKSSRHERMSPANARTRAQAEAAQRQTGTIGSTAMSRDGGASPRSRRSPSPQQRDAYGSPVSGPAGSAQQQWEQLEKRLMQALQRELHRQLRRAAVANIDPTAIGDPDGLAAAMVAALPISHAFDDMMGPFYDTTGLAAWLQVSARTLHARVQAATLLGCPLDDGGLVFPAWQFLDNGGVVPGLAAVLKILSSGTDDAWQIALWLNAPSSELRGTSARAWLLAGRRRGAVVSLATRRARQWAQ